MFEKKWGMRLWTGTSTFNNFKNQTKIKKATLQCFLTKLFIHRKFLMSMCQENVFTRRHTLTFRTCT